MDWLPFHSFGNTLPDYPFRHEWIEFKNSRGEVSIVRYADLAPEFNVWACYWRPYSPPQGG